MMRLCTRPAGFLLLLFAFAWKTLPAQQVARSRTDSTTSQQNARGATRQGNPAVRLLSLDEGLSILGAALESRVHAAGRSDCSHLVHAIYERAGFPYPYAKASDLYAGTSDFRRVARPQPGDLVTWPGHVGIAISGAQHTFYSALSSGLGVEDYEAPYWRSRGRARFFRYVKAAPATLNASNHVASLTPAIFGDAEPRGDQEKSATNPRTSLAPDANAAIPTTAIVDSARPSAGEVADALSQTFIETADALRGKNVLALPQPLIVFERLEVERVRIEHGQQWVEVRMAHPSVLGPGPSKSSKRPERQRWPLRYRSKNSWEVALPQGETYLPRDAAVRVLAHQLTEIADNPEAPTGERDKAQLARLLNWLLQK